MCVCIYIVLFLLFNKIWKKREEEEEEDERRPKTIFKNEDHLPKFGGS